VWTEVEDVDALTRFESAISLCFFVHRTFSICIPSFNLHTHTHTLTPHTHTHTHTHTRVDDGPPHLVESDEERRRTKQANDKAAGLINSDQEAKENRDAAEIAARKRVAEGLPVLPSANGKIMMVCYVLFCYCVFLLQP
jgi:hypothetical protein